MKAFFKGIARVIGRTAWAVFWAAMAGVLVFLRVEVTGENWTLGFTGGSDHLIGLGVVAVMALIVAMLFSAWGRYQEENEWCFLGLVNNCFKLLAGLVLALQLLLTNVAATIDGWLITTPSHWVVMSGVSSALFICAWVFEPRHFCRPERHD